MPCGEVTFAYSSVVGGMSCAGLSPLPSLDAVLDMGSRPVQLALMCRWLMMLYLRDMQGESVGAVSRLMGLSRRNATRGIGKARWLVAHDALYGEVFGRVREACLSDDGRYGL